MGKKLSKLKEIIISKLEYERAVASTTLPTGGCHSKRINEATHNVKLLTDISTAIDRLSGDSLVNRVAKDESDIPTLSKRLKEAEYDVLRVDVKNYTIQQGLIAASIKSAIIKANLTDDNSANGISYLIVDLLSKADLIK